MKHIRLFILGLIATTPLSCNKPKEEPRDGGGEHLTTGTKIQPNQMIEPAPVALAMWPIPADEPLDNSWDGDVIVKSFGFKFNSGTIRTVGPNFDEEEYSPNDPGTASGSFESVVGTHTFSLTFTKGGFVYSDSSLSHLIKCAPVATDGEMIVPWLFDLEEVPDVYVNNSFSARLIGSKWTVISLDKEKGDSLTIPVDDGMSPAWSWPGSKVRLGNRILERKKDGWYENSKKISP